MKNGAVSGNEVVSCPFYVEESNVVPAGINPNDGWSSGLNPDGAPIPGPFPRPVFPRNVLFGFDGNNINDGVLFNHRDGDPVAFTQQIQPPILHFHKVHSNRGPILQFYGIIHEGTSIIRFMNGTTPAALDHVERFVPNGGDPVIARYWDAIDTIDMDDGKILVAYHNSITNLMETYIWDPALTPAGLTYVNGVPVPPQPDNGVRSVGHDSNGDFWFLLFHGTTFGPGMFTLYKADGITGVITSKWTSPGHPCAHPDGTAKFNPVDGMIYIIYWDEGAMELRYIRFNPVTEMVVSGPTSIPGPVTFPGDMAYTEDGAKIVIVGGAAWVIIDAVTMLSLGFVPDVDPFTLFIIRGVDSKWYGGKDKFPASGPDIFLDMDIVAFASAVVNADTSTLTCGCAGTGLTTFLTPPVPVP